MSTKSMFFHVLISELIFFLVCIFIFVAHLAFWLDEIGIAESVININITPSLTPIYILGIFYILAIFTFAVALFKIVKRLQRSNFNSAKRAYLLTLGCHLLAFSVSLLLKYSQDFNPMKTVIPSLVSFYFAIIFILLLTLYFALFLRTNTNAKEVE